MLICVLGALGLCLIPRAHFFVAYRINRVCNFLPCVIIGHFAPGEKKTNPAVGWANP